MVYMDTTGLLPGPLEESQYVVMIVDSAPRLQCPTGTRDENTSAILSVVKRFLADLGVAAPVTTPVPAATTLVSASMPPPTAARSETGVRGEYANA